MVCPFGAEMEAPRPEVASVTGRLVFHRSAIRLRWIDSSAAGHVGGGSRTATSISASLCWTARWATSRGNRTREACSNRALSTLHGSGERQRCGGDDVCEARSGPAGRPRSRSQRPGPRVSRSSRVPRVGRRPHRRGSQPRAAAQGLQARSTFTPERITLSGLEGRLERGTLSGSGGLALWAEAA